MFPQIGVVHHTGHFVYVIAVHSKSACSPNFEGFPWGMQVIWVLPPRFPVRFAVFSLGRGSTASMGLSTDCLEIAPLASPISNPLLGGRSLLQRNPKTLFTSSQVVNTKSRLVSGLARNPLVISFRPWGNLDIQIFKPCNIIKVSEPTYFVTYDIGFKRETYFDGAFGVLKKVKVLLKNWDCNS